MKELLVRSKKALKNKKGFTLIEMIVVLIIIAALAAAAIPGMMHYADEARQKALLSECRTIYIAAQTVATKAVTEGIDGSKPVKPSAVFSGTTMTTGYKQVVAYYADMYDEIGSAPTSVTNQFDVYGSSSTGKVTSVYYEKGGLTVTINDDGSIEYGTA